MQTLEYREAHLSRRSSRPGRAWSSAPSAPFPSTCKSGSALRWWVSNLLQTKSQENKTHKDLLSASLVPSLAEALGFCARMRELCPKWFQCCPSLSSIRCIHSPNSGPSSPSPLHPTASFLTPWRVFSNQNGRMCSYQVATKMSGDPKHCISRNKW